MSYSVKLSGFRTKEEAKGFLKWFEGQGEGDDTIGEWMGDPNIVVNCDVKRGMIEHPDGFEYMVKIYD